jgi:GH18 family chitinase
MIIVALVVSLFPGRVVRADLPPGTLLTAYLSGWTLNALEGTLAITLHDIDFTKLTHIYVGEINGTSASDATLYSGWGITQEATWVADVKAEIAAQGATTKVLIRLYDPGAGVLHGIGDNAGLRATLVSNIHTFLNTNSLDGVDVDWEEVASYESEGGKTDELVNELATAINPSGHIVTIAGAPERLNVTYATCGASLAIINVMSYDMGNPAHSTYADSVASIEMWATEGFAKSKIVMGLPAYAKDNDGAVALWSDVIRELNPTDDQVSESLGSISVPWFIGPILIDGGVIWYGGIDLCKQKTQYVIDNGFAGMMVWDVGEDEWLAPSRGFTTVAYNLLASVTPPTLSSIAVTPNPPSHLKVGSTQQFTATGTYNDSSQSNITSSVTWTSSNTSVATMAAGGLATGVAAGTTSITANMSGVTSPGVTLTVKALSSMAVTPNPSANLTAGSTEQFTVTGTYTDSSTENITSSASWVSSNTSVATIASGLATGVAAGSTNISANKTGIYSANVSLTVVVPTLDSIAVTPNPVSALSVGATQQFIATGHYTNNSTATLTTSVTWVSSNASVATISSVGLSTGVALGTTQISANMSGIFSSNVSLSVKVLTSIAVTPNPSTNMGVGSTQNFAATGTYSDNSTGDITSIATWVSANTTFATVSSGGLATALAVGTTSISANRGGIYSANVSLRVVAPVATLVSIAVTPVYPPSIAIGRTQQFIATGTYNDNSTAIITATVVWISTDTGKASIGGTGLATGIGVGSTSITAHGGAISSPSVTLSIYSSTFTPTYVGTSGTAFTKEFYPFFIVLGPILIGLKMFEGGNKPISSLFLLLIIVFLTVAFLPTIVGALSGL